MREGGYICQCFSLFTHLGALKKRGESPFTHVLGLADFWKTKIAEYPDIIGQVTTAESMEENARMGKLSAMMIRFTKRLVSLLYALYDKGVRMSTLTWNFANELGYPNPAIALGSPRIPDMVNGLTDTGKSFVEEMERIGILIDVSHLNDAGIRDIFELTHGPVIASHSNARTLCSHLRNLSDTIIRMIGERGGVIGINYFVGFLEDGGKIGRIEKMVEHMQYIKNLAGIDAIALGSDFDGFGESCELSGAEKMQQLAAEMERQGFSSAEIEKVFALNALRVFRSVLS